MAHEIARFMRLEIADGGAGKKPDPRQGRNAGWQVEFFGEIRDHGLDRQARKIAAELGYVLLQEISGNIDRNIGFHRRRRAEQDPRFAARAGAEFDQRTARREQRGYRGRVILQKGEFAPRRIIFRQCRDPVEQSRSRSIVKILRRQPLRLRGEAGDNIGCERIGWRSRPRCHIRGLDDACHGFAQFSYSARRRPANCQRAAG